MSHYIKNLVPCFVFISNLNLRYRSLQVNYIDIFIVYDKNVILRQIHGFAPKNI